VGGGWHGLNGRALTQQGGSPEFNFHCHKRRSLHLLHCHNNILIGATTMIKIKHLLMYLFIIKLENKYSLHLLPVFEIIH
jgi:hypothetical protein